MHNRDILISGASVAGPSLAYWLRRYGFRPTVVERAPTLRDGGYAVDFRGASVRVLERMGVLEAVKQAQTHMGAVAYVDSAHRVLASMPAEFLSGEVEILRGDLARILYEATQNDAEYLFNDSITSLTESEEGVHVTFERSPPRTFHLVVGADGLHSHVRTLAFGEEARFRRDLGFYISIFTTANHLNLDYAGRLYNVPGKLAGMYSARRNTEAKAFFCFASAPLQYDRRDTQQQKELLAQAYAGVDWEVPRLLASMAEAPDFYFDSVSQIHMDRWSKGRTVLLGDAACCASPLSGMGTGMAVVGAYVLAGELKASMGDHRTAFARYEEQMRPFVARCQKFADGAGSFFVAPSHPMIWLRNQMYRMLPYLPWKGAIANQPLRAANSIQLRDYHA